MEENGANTLYVGLGLLKWFETDVSEKPRYAPILLIPVEIIRKSAQRGYVIRSREEETIMNITLLEMIRHDFGINIGGLDTLPKDESGVNVKMVFNIIRQAVMSKKRWDVEEQALLGTFSFSKFILWNDIHNNADELAKNKVVASLLSGKLEWQAHDTVSVDDIMDDELHPSSVALPISTDSSQLQAVVNASKGRSFVLHGPPGTQAATITNMIANALYEGKRVLFVAAKKAALDVVENVAKAMSSDSHTATVPIVLLTSVDHIDFGRMVIDFGISAHLTKPARSSALLGTVIAVIQKARAQGTKASLCPARARGRRRQCGDHRAARAAVDRLGRGGNARAAPQTQPNAPIDILIAEDNEVNQLVFGQILNGLGLTYRIAGNGRTAVEMYRALQPKLILMDVSMPEMNGYEAARAIRAVEARTGSHTPIIGVTAHALKGDREKCLEAGHGRLSAEAGLAGPARRQDRHMAQRECVGQDSVSLSS